MIKHNEWSTIPREDLRYIPELEKAGWAVEFSYKDKLNGRTTPEHCPADAVSFRKGDYHIWNTYTKGWAYAKLYMGSFIEHQYGDITDFIYK